MSDNEIPQWSRDLVIARARGRCERCGGKGAHWHHRRSRRVRDEHRHCPCNGVWLCADCHAWAHHEVVTARDQGWVVSQYETWPGAVPVQTLYAPLKMTCLGTATLVA